MISLMSEMDEFVRLSRILVGRDGQRCFKASNSPTIIYIKLSNKRLFIKQFHNRLYISLTSSAHDVVYITGQDGKPVVVPWCGDLVPFLSEIRRRLVLDALTGI